MGPQDRICFGPGGFAPSIPQRDVAPAPPSPTPTPPLGPRQPLDPGLMAVLPKHLFQIPCLHICDDFRYLGVDICDIILGTCLPTDVIHDDFRYVVVDYVCDDSGYLFVDLRDVWWFQLLVVDWCDTRWFQIPGRQQFGVSITGPSVTAHHSPLSAPSTAVGSPGKIHLSTQRVCQLGGEHRIRASGRRSLSACKGGLIAARPLMFLPGFRLLPPTPSRRAISAAEWLTVVFILFVSLNRDDILGKRPRSKIQWLDCSG